MKTGFWDRILVYLYVLITVVVIAAVLLMAFDINVIALMIGGLSANMPGIFWRLVLAGICALIAVLGVYVAVVVTPSRKKKNAFVTLSSDNGGEVRVSLSAIREMAGQAIRNARGLEDVAINITEASDAIEVNITMDVECGVHVPTVTMNMQRAIKSNIERNCGINVRSVTVDVKNVLPCADGSQIEEVEVVPVVSQEAAEEPEQEHEVYLVVADTEDSADQCAVEENVADNADAAELESASFVEEAVAEEAAEAVEKTEDAQEEA